MPIPYVSRLHFYLYDSPFTCTVRTKFFLSHVHQLQDLIKKAIEVSKAAQLEWDCVPIKKKVSIWRKAADLMATKYRSQLNATTMCGQSKTVIQAEIDAACELIDFVR